MFDSAPTAVLFPGQGSQTSGMRDLVASKRPDLLETLLDAVGCDPFPLVQDSTRFAQPAIAAASLAGYAQLKQELTPVAVAGHSLGEITALAAAGAIDEHDAIALAAERGRLMADAAELAGGSGTMLALIGATPAQAQRLASAHQVTVANDNAPGQIVLSGDRDRLKQLRKQAKQDGVRAIPLDVAGAFHSPHMASAELGLRKALARVHIRRPRTTVISCATAQPFDDIRERLAQALTQPVRWRATMRTLQGHGATHFVDAGPADVLAKLVGRNLPDASVATIEEATHAFA